MITALFGSEESCKKLGTSIGLEEEDNNRKALYKFLQDRVIYGFERLKTLYEVTDEKLIAVIMETIRQMLIRCNDPQLQVAKLQTVVGRREFEAHFLKHCVPESEGNFQ